MSFKDDLPIRTTKDGFHQYRLDEKKSSVQGTHVTFDNGLSHALVSAHVPMVLEDERHTQIKTKEGGLMTSSFESVVKSDFTFVELFAGIGGVSFGFERVGGKCVMAAEYDPQAKTQFAQQSYKALHPETEDVRGDVCEIEASSVPDHDVLSFTTPCQSFSVAGKRGGFDDVRGTLYFEAMRIAAEKKPKVIFMENVKGLIGNDGGKTLDTIVKVANECGYRVDFTVLNSKYFGVPQNRERFFMVGVRDDLIEREDWTIEGTNVVAKGKRRISGYDDVKTFNFDWPEQTEVTTRLRDILETEVDERYYLDNYKTLKLLERVDDDGIKVKGELEGGPWDKRYEAIRRVYETSGTGPTVTAGGGGGVEPKIAEVKSIGNTHPSGKGMNGQVYDVEAGLSPTLTTNKGEGTKIAEPPKYRIRKLTPLECFRLQGFSDESFDKLAEAGVSNSQLYKQAGNAVTVNVIHAIGERLVPYLKDEN